MTSLYDTDLAAWVHEQIEHLKNRELDKIDWENFIDEVEGVVRVDKRSMKSHFVTIICHLLKYKYQPLKRTRSWAFSILHARDEINEIVKDSPSLKHSLPIEFEKAWKSGRDKAISETDMSGKDFPRTCPWSYEYVMTTAIDMKDFR